jgi:hypothetical protein
MNASFAQILREDDYLLSESMMVTLDFMFLRRRSISILSVHPTRCVSQETTFLNLGIAGMCFKCITGIRREKWGDT